MILFSAPSRQEIIKELADWAKTLQKTIPEIIKIGLFGSYAQKTYAIGSDLDLLIIVSRSTESRWFMRQAVFDTERLILPVDLFVYTQAEAIRMECNNLWFQSILKDVIWLVK